ncbi:ParB N-terminal domain-containing protein [Lentisphaerota bacterium WC36G]|nr:ParB N-terminal domain-containing protein [Lentisphaerae bacterium WC36]
MKRIASKKVAVDNLKVWTVAEKLLPEYSPEQYFDLEEFLAKGGELAPIVVNSEFVIIDGYNRWRLANKLSITEVECDVYEYADDAEMEMHAIVLNSKRRHLNKLQIARAAVRLASLEKIDDAVEVEEEAVENEASNVAESLANEDTIEVVEKDIFVENNNDIKNNDVAEEVINECEELELSRNSEMNFKLVAKKLGVPQSTVKQVNEVDNSHDKTLITAMEDKIITIKQAAEIAQLAEEKRQEAIEKYDLERMKRNSVGSVLTRSCDTFRKKLKSQQKKIADAELSIDDCELIREQMHQIIDETRVVLELLKSENSE